MIEAGKDALTPFAASDRVQHLAIPHVLFTVTAVHHQQHVTGFEQVKLGSENSMLLRVTVNVS
jgi:hypothetical protein